MLFTIITVTLNSEKTILKTIESIDNQTFKNFEYIIIDGGSNDQTLKIIEKNLQKETLIISEKDRGIYNAMNKGIENSKGEYVGFLNSDDWFDNNTLEIVNDFISSNKSDIVYGDAKFYDKGKLKFYAKAEIKNLSKDMSLLHSSFYVKRNLIKQFKFNEDMLITSDYEQMIKLKNSHKFSYINSSLSNVSMGGISSNLLLSSKEFYLIQLKYFGLINSAINYIKKYHYHMIKIFYFSIKRLF